VNLDKYEKIGNGLSKNAEDGIKKGLNKIVNSMQQEDGDATLNLASLD